MHYLVLESVPGSEYADTASDYEFPTRYLRHFSPLNEGEPMLAVIYEPRGRQHQGRMAYIGYAILTEAPRSNLASMDRQLWTVRYEEGIQLFRRPVPRRIDGEPIESWLRGKPNIVASGNAIRPLPEPDLARIVEVAGETELAVRLGITYQTGQADRLTEPSRTRRNLTAIVRDARFRSNVLAAYGYQCCITGLGGGNVSPRARKALVQAAHIRPAAQGGPDDIRNGLALTPTLHGLFDAGMFALKYVADGVVLEVSPELSIEAFESPYSDELSLRIRDGQRIVLPNDKGCWPDPEMLKYHRQVIFRD